ncbi:MAG: PorP/SprF family type IX secretion system membrane protein [Cellulophaga sp.]
MLTIPKFKFILIGLFCCFFQMTIAQQTPVFSEYNYNPFIINSAYAGFEKEAELTFSNSGFSNQFEGAPRNIAFSFNTPLNKGKMGLGAGVFQNKIGVTSTTTAFAAYSYKLFFDHKNGRPHWQHYYPTVLSFGITAGAQLYRDNLLELGITDDPNFQENINATIPSIGIGFMFNYNDLFVGASSPNVLGTKLASVDNLELSNPFYAYIGYRFFTDLFRKTMIKPSFLLKSEAGAPLQADINMAVNFNNRIEIGGGYRSNGSLNLLVGLYAIKNFRFIYNYNMASGNAPIAKTHGFVLSYRFGEGYYK